MKKQELILEISNITDEIVRQAQKFKGIGKNIKSQNDHLRWVISCRFRNLELDLRELQEWVRDETSVRS